MHLKRLKIDNYRSLKNFEIDFTHSAVDEEGELQIFRTHAIIGSNGAGKSNLMEAIVTIFRDLDLYNTASFGYELDYEIRDHTISVKAQEGAYPSVEIDGNPDVDSWILSDTRRETDTTVEYFGIKDNVKRGQARTYLPSYIFAYYSGKNERMECLFQDHQRQFIDNLSDFDSREDEDALIRRFFYCRNGHSQLVLLACLLAQESEFEEILDDFKIKQIDSALFTLKRPFRLDRTFTEQELEAGDEHFWYDDTRFSQNFLSKLLEYSIAPISHTKTKLVDFRGRTEEQEQLYLFLDDKGLEKLKAEIGETERFFNELEGSYISDLIEDVQINVQYESVGGNIAHITSNQLSEGELQFLTVLGLMRVTSKDHCLFLLDEPDTHLNPIWKLRYFEEIEKVIKKEDDSPLAGDSQILITTHDPMMIGSLRKEQVRILRKPEVGQNVTVDTPSEHPQGMGVSGLLKSEMFGLASTLDIPTRKKLEKRNELLAKRAKGQLTNDEKAKLEKLKHYLEDLGFSGEYRDPLYQLFIEKMYEVRSQPLDKLLSPKELEEQDALAQKILEEMVKNERAEKLKVMANAKNQRG